MSVEVLDLTRKLDGDLYIYSDGTYSDPPLMIEDWCSVQSQGYKVSRISIGTQCGTHIDAPSHFMEGGAELGALPLEALIGKYFLLDHKALVWSEKYFSKHGDLTILICRFIPVVRHIISIPAGMGRMNLLKFSIYTIIGAGLWNAFLTYVGMHWGQDGWDLLMKYSHPIDIAILVLLVIAVAWFILRHFRKK